MNNAMLRIDDRLLHGQVLLGWATFFRPDLIILADDSVAGDESLRSLYLSMCEGDYSLRVETLAAASRSCRQAAMANKRFLVVVRGPMEAVLFKREYPELDSVNVGGMHYAEGKKKLLDYVFLSREECMNFQRLLNQGVYLEARDLPSRPLVVLDAKALKKIWPEEDC